MQKAKSQTLLGKVALLLAFGLAGCNQNSLGDQIEKCVQAGIKMHEPYKDAETRNRTEVHARLACLRAASGKEN